MFKVGARVLAVAPAGSDDEEGEEGASADRWVPGRVLGERSHAGTKQYKISLDGYDSEDDAWVDCDDPRVKPYVADAGGGGAGGGDADAKAAAKRDQEERERARKFAEQRKADARSAHSAAAGRLDTGK